jgi:histone deacetylase complex regulatory component SIN3
MSGPSSANIKSTDDILAYLNEINDSFKDEVQKFDDFRGVMRDFKEKRFDLFIILIENCLNFLFVTNLFLSV